MIESMKHFFTSLFSWILENAGQFILGILIAWVLRRIQHSNIEKLIWNRHSKDLLIVVYGGYEEVKNVSKKVVDGEKNFSIKCPVDKVEVLPYCDFVRCWNNLNNRSIDFMSDVDVRNMMKRSFLSLGGPEYNIKSNQIMKNNYFKLVWPRHGENFVINGREFKTYHTSKEYEYAVIMRQTTEDSHSYMLCAGLEAAGTQAAGNFLAEKWKDILKKVCPSYWFPFKKVPDFLIILRFPKTNFKEGEIRYAAIYQNGAVKELFYSKE